MARKKAKTDAMIAQPGTLESGYTLRVDYDPENDDAFEAKAIFNDGTVKNINGHLGQVTDIDMLISRRIISCETDAPAIGQNAFRGCNLLQTLIINNAESIESRGVGYCNALKYVYISSACTNIDSEAFGFTAQSTLVIDCGFSADSPAAAGAPWGATGATINYDVPAPNPPAMSTLSMAPIPDLIQNIDTEIETDEDIQPAETATVKKSTRKAVK